MSDLAAPVPAESDPAMQSWLAHVPVALFAVVMGFAGLALALRAVERALGLGGLVSAAALILTGLVFCAVAAIYGAKALRYPASVAADWSHPVRIAFFPALSISILLIATAAAPLVPQAARALWVGGMLLQGALTLAVVASWIGHRPFQAMHLTPAWFIPAVGNVVVPVAGPGFGFPEISWLFFSAGLMFWLVLLTLVMNRLIFHDPIPARLLPTLVILIAPPAVGFIAWTALTGTVDPFARILLNSGYVFAAVVLTQAPRFLRLPFALSWWALSFPVAALAVASLLFAAAEGSAVHRGIGLGLVLLLCCIVGALSLRTLAALWAGAVFRPE